MNSKRFIPALLGQTWILTLILISVSGSRLEGAVFQEEEIGGRRAIRSVKKAKIGKTKPDPKKTARKKTAKANQEGAEDNHDHVHGHDSSKTKAKDSKSKEAPGGPLEVTGPLDEISEPLSKLLNMKRKGGRLICDLPTSYSDANASFQQIRTKARGGGGGHGSGNFWTQYFQSQNMGGRIQKSEQNFGNNKPKPDSFVAEFLEATEGAREVQVYGEDSDEFSVRISGGHQPYQLQMVQTKSGFTVHEVWQENSFAGGAEDFEQFCRAHPDFVQTRLIPVMKKYGIGSPVTRFNSVTRDHVLKSLAPIDVERVAKFRKEYGELESEEYEQREAANQLLEKNFQDWKDVITVAITDESFSLETRSRLQKLIKKMSSEADRALVALVTSADLKNDHEYLVWLLEQAMPEQRPWVVRRLEKVSGEALGDDLVAWKKWLKDDREASVAVADEAPIQSSLANAEGYLPQMAEQTANLLRFKLDDRGRLKLDRQFWSDQFNGESIQDLIGKVQSEFEKSNLPKAWFNAGGGFPASSIGHEHVLFEHIKAGIPSQISNNHYSYGSLSARRNSQKNRNVEKPHLMMGLETEKIGAVDRFGRNQTKVEVPQIFRYHARERQDFYASINVVEQPVSTDEENKDTRLTITIASPDSASMLHLYQDATGKVTCSLANRNSKIEIQAASFASLYQDERAVLTTHFYPVFKRFGIQFDPALGGPFEIKNADKPAKKSSP